MEKLTDRSTRELNLFRDFKAGQARIYDYFFERYYQGLCVYACRLVGSESVSKDLVQDFFLRFWENRRTLEIHTSVKSYFIRSVHNRCLDYLSFNQIRMAYRQHQLLWADDDDLLEYPLLDFELKAQIDLEISRLPDEIRDTFRLNRFEGLSYQQIAGKKQISVKTVEYRISKALEALRKGLDNYTYLLIL